MKQLVAKLDEGFAERVEEFSLKYYKSKSDMVRDALERLMREKKREVLREDLERYLSDRVNLERVAGEVEDRMAVTKEALEGVED
jgi:metal-responsive CopG/Arc/MetJ family transcriptional regulator